MTRRARGADGSARRRCARAAPGTGRRSGPRARRGAAPARSARRIPRRCRTHPGPTGRAQPTVAGPAPPPAPPVRRSRDTATPSSCSSRLLTAATAIRSASANRSSTLRRCIRRPRGDRDARERAHREPYRLGTREAGEVQLLRTKPFQDHPPAASRVVDAAIGRPIEGHHLGGDCSAHRRRPSGVKSNGGDRRGNPVNAANRGRKIPAARRTVRGGQPYSASRTRRTTRLTLSSVNGFSSWGAPVRARNARVPGLRMSPVTKTKRRVKCGSRRSTSR